MHAVMVVFLTAARKGGPVVVGTFTGGSDVLVQSQEEYKASSYLREIEAEIQRQRQLALAMGGIRPLQPGEDGPAYQRWATPGITLAVPRIPRQQGNGEVGAPSPNPAAPAPTAEGGLSGGSLGVGEEERRLQEEIEVEISAEEEASLLTEFGDSYLYASRPRGSWPTWWIWWPHRVVESPPLGRELPLRSWRPLSR